MLLYCLFLIVICVSYWWCLEGHLAKIAPVLRKILRVGTFKYVNNIWRMLKSVFFTALYIYCLTLGPVIKKILNKYTTYICCCRRSCCLVTHMARIFSLIKGYNFIFMWFNIFKPPPVPETVMFCMHLSLRRCVGASMYLRPYVLCFRDISNIC